MTENTNEEVNTSYAELRGLADKWAPPSGSWERTEWMVGHDTGRENCAAELRQFLTPALEELDSLRARLQEREHDMHMRIRLGYDQTVADCWKEHCAKIEAERDALQAQVAGKEKELIDYIEEAGNAHIKDLDRLRGDVEEARTFAKACLQQSRVVSCVYCGHQYPDGTPQSQSDLLTAHIKVCDKHPLRVVEAERDDLQRQLSAKKPEKLFPIMIDRKVPAGTPTQIPWPIAVRAYTDYAARYGTEQSVERLAGRGGFHYGEMDRHLPGWRDEVNELLRVQAECAALRAEKAQMQEWLDEKQQFIEYLEASDGRMAITKMTEALQPARTVIAEIYGVAPFTRSGLKPIIAKLDEALAVAKEAGP